MQSADSDPPRMNLRRQPPVHRLVLLLAARIRDSSAVSSVDGDVCTVSWQGRAGRLPDSKGLQDPAQLVDRREEERPSR